MFRKTGGPLLQSAGDPGQVLLLEGSIGVHAPTGRNLQHAAHENHRVGHMTSLA